MLYPLSSEMENAVNLIGQIKVISHYPVTVRVNEMVLCHVRPLSQSKLRITL